MVPLPRKHLTGLPEVCHGALDFGELEQYGLRPGQVIDFSSNTNAFGPPPGVREALSAVIAGTDPGASIEHYPDREAWELRRRLAARLNIDVNSIMAGNGTAELIQLVCLAYLEPGDEALIVGPTFGEYARFASLAGARVGEWRASPGEGFALDEARIERQLTRGSFKMVFVCNPNNPTGQALPAQSLVRLTRTYQGTMFVIDEAYLAFAGEAAGSVIGAGQGRIAPNLLVLRSMTKDYALAGLRLGYAAGPTEVLSAMRKVQPPWSVNSLAQAAGIAALEDSAFLQDSLTVLRSEAQRMQAALQGLGYQTSASVVHFFLLKTHAGSRFPNGTALREALRSRGLLVRDCTSFGLPEYVRIVARRPAEHDRLLEAMKEITL